MGLVRKAFVLEYRELDEEMTAILVGIGAQTHESASLVLILMVRADCQNNPVSSSPSAADAVIGSWQHPR